MRDIIAHKIDCLALLALYVGKHRSPRTEELKKLLAIMRIREDDTESTDNQWTKVSIFGLMAVFNC